LLSSNSIVCLLRKSYELSLYLAQEVSIPLLAKQPSGIDDFASFSGRDNLLVKISDSF